MRIIHKADYGLEERIMFKPIVYANAIHSMSLILHAVERLGIDLDSEERFNEALEELLGDYEDYSQEQGGRTEEAEERTRFASLP